MECVSAANLLAIRYDQVHELFFQNPDFGFYFMQLAAARVTGAKSWAVSEKMVAPTRDDSIQPGCDHPTGAVWSVACGTAAACGEAAG
jgi:hypothetical protein